MSKQQELHDLIQRIRDERKSGKIYIYGRENNIPRAGIMIVKHGEIENIDYLRKPSAVAFSELLSLEIIKITFVSQTDDAPAKLLDQVSNELKQEAQRLLEKLYGAGIAKEVEGIAIKFPPHQKPKDFLDKCKDKAMLMLSREKAEQIFAPLYAKIP